MTQRRMVFLAVLILGVPAAWLGFRLGQVPSESQIIESYAARFMRNSGQEGLPNCVARPHDAPDIRMVITCEGADGRTQTYFTDKRGAPVRAPERPEA